MGVAFTDAVQNIIDAGHRLEARNLVPAAGGNFSMRLDDERVAITVSGRFKGRMHPEDLMTVDMHGRPLVDKTPSAETLLHCSLYRMYPEVNAVLHVHSVPATVLSRHLPDVRELHLNGYEMLKAMPGVETHETSVTVPVFDNTQDIPDLTGRVEAKLRETKGAPAYILRGHGLYAWGRDLAEAERVVEGMELLLTCELETVKITGHLSPGTGDLPLM